MRRFFKASNVIAGVIILGLLAYKRMFLEMLMCIVSMLLDLGLHLSVDYSERIKEDRPIILIYLARLLTLSTFVFVLLYRFPSYSRIAWITGIVSARPFYIQGKSSARVNRIAVSFGWLHTLMGGILTAVPFVVMYRMGLETQYILFLLVVAVILALTQFPKYLKETASKRQRLFKAQ